MDNLVTIDPRLIKALKVSIKKPLIEADIKPETDIVNEIGIDSLSLMALTIQLESVFEIDVASNIHLLMKVITVSDLQKYVDDLSQ